jgi:hypothetical protein
VQVASLPRANSPTTTVSEGAREEKGRPLPWQPRPSPPRRGMGGGRAPGFVVLAHSLGPRGGGLEAWRPWHPTAGSAFRRREGRHRWAPALLGGTPRGARRCRGAGPPLEGAGTAYSNPVGDLHEARRVGGASTGTWGGEFGPEGNKLVMRGQCDGGSRGAPCSVWAQTTAAVSRHPPHLAAN